MLASPEYAKPQGTANSVDNRFPGSRIALFPSSSVPRLRRPRQRRREEETQGGENDKKFVFSNESFLCVTRDLCARDVSINLNTKLTSLL